MWFKWRDPPAVSRLVVVAGTTIQDRLNSNLKWDIGKVCKC